MTFIAWSAAARGRDRRPSVTWEAFSDGCRIQVQNLAGGARADRRGGPYPAGSRARMIVEIALASRTAPRDWWDEDDATIATALAILARIYGRRR